jgi:mercuric ion binding protein
MKTLLYLLFATLFSQSVFATEKTVTLAVKNMTCAMCPITVKKSLQKVEGVNEVDISFKKKTATVTYDDKTTSTDELVEATTNVGYPSSVNKTKVKK